MLWLFIVPQIILLLLNLNSFWIISKEVSSNKVHVAYLSFYFEVFLLFLAGFIWLYYQMKKSEVHVLWNIVLLLTHIGYLCHVGFHLWQVFPNNIEPWILDGEAVIFAQFTFIMPGLFYAGLRLACFDTKLKTRTDFGLSLLFAVLAPVIYYIFFVGFRGYSVTNVWKIPTFITILLFIGITILAFIGIIRAFVFIYNGIQSKGEVFQVVFASIVCLAGPIGGLLLNKQIPFPADFQSSWVYVLTIINGLIVLVPSAKKGNGHGYLLFARALTYPFTLYFFLVFLPFLPLALPAMFALGIGFLFLVPVLLFLIHTKKLFGDFNFSYQESGIGLAVGITLIGLSILPAYFTVEALRDKSSLGSALQYVYAPDYKKDFEFKGSVASVKRTLINLKEFKEGIQLPYLSGFYNSIVFEGLVLPDNKIEYMYKLFTGEKLPKAQPKQSWGWGMLRGGRASAVTRAATKDRRVDITSIDIQNESMGEVVKTRLRLEMLNAGDSDQAEFLREISIPVGVLISGFSLKMGAKFVPGQIFEKRAAMWVYHMIRDFTRRDPGILTYMSPTQVELKIYPFMRSERRIAEIEFQFLKGQSPVISLGDKKIALGQEDVTVSNDSVLMGRVNQSELFAIFSKETFSSLPHLKRRPYFHFILDASKDGSLDVQGYMERINYVKSQYPNIKMAKVTVANFDLEDLTITPLMLDEMNKVIDKSTLPHQGMLDLGRVLKQELIKYNAELDSDWQDYPLFVLITKDSSRVVPDVIEDMAFFRRYLADTNYYLMIATPNAVEKRLLWSKMGSPEDQDVVALKVNNSIAVLPVNLDSMQIAHFKEVASTNAISIYDPNLAEFIPLAKLKILPDNLPYFRALSVVFKNYASITNPADFNQDLSTLVKSSRELGVMIPSTSYIILERSSQWKTLQVKEKQRLSASEGLEFDEGINTPAPSWLMMIIFLFLAFWIKDRRLVSVTNFLKNKY